MKENPIGRTSILHPILVLALVATLLFSTIARLSLGGFYVVLCGLPYLAIFGLHAFAHIRAMVRAARGRRGLFVVIPLSHLFLILAFLFQVDRIGAWGIAAWEIEERGPPRVLTVFARLFDPEVTDRGLFHWLHGFAVQILKAPLGAQIAYYLGLFLPVIITWVLLLHPNLYKPIKPAPVGSPPH